MKNSIQKFMLVVITTSSLLLSSLSPFVVSAAQANNSDITSFVSTYFADRGHAIHNTSKLSAVTLKSVHSELETLRTSIIKSGYESIGAKIINVVETANFDSISPNTDGTFSVNTTVVDEINWNDVGGVSRRSVVTIPHQSTLKKTSSGITFIKDEYTEEPFGVNSNDLQSARSRASTPRLTKQNTTSATLSNNRIVPYTLDRYNRTSAVYYAHQYTSSSAIAHGSTNYDASYNSLFIDFNGPAGGDCTNFASQALYLGGGLPLVGSSNVAGETMSTSNWYYLNHGSTNQSTHSYTSSWALAADSYTYQMGAGYGYSGGTLSNAQLGDLIYVKWHTGEAIHHVFIVTGADSGGNPIITCHNVDMYDVPYASDIYSDSTPYVALIHYY